MEAFGRYFKSDFVQNYSYWACLRYMQLCKWVIYELVTIVMVLIEMFSCIFEILNNESNIMVKNFHNFSFNGLTYDIITKDYVCLMPNIQR